MFCMDCTPSALLLHSHMTLDVQISGPWENYSTNMCFYIFCITGTLRTWLLSYVPIHVLRGLFPEVSMAAQTCNLTYFTCVYWGFYVCSAVYRFIFFKFCILSFLFSFSHVPHHVWHVSFPEVSMMCSVERLCGVVVKVPVCRHRGPGFDSRSYRIFWVVVGLERGPLSLVSINEELLERNVAVSVKKSEINGRKSSAALTTGALTIPKRWH
jgi:hypothetical protein